MFSMSKVMGKVAETYWNIIPDKDKEYIVAMGKQAELVNRDKKYAKITTAIHFASTFNPFCRFFPGIPRGLAPSLFISYHFFREADDIADGDVELPEGYNSFHSLSEDLKNAMYSGVYPDTDTGILLRGTVRDMETFCGVDVREDICYFLDAMENENQRRLNKTTSTRKELYDLYQASFGVPQDVAFMGVGSKVRSSYIPELADLQGRLYAVRDLEKEMEKGIIFIPKEVLVKDFDAYPFIGEWIMEELSEGKGLIDKLNDTRMDFKGRRVVNFLVKGIEDYINKEMDKVFK